MFKIITIISALVLTNAVLIQDTKEDNTKKVEQKAQDKSRPVDVIFTIDCSGSMGGIIETAKQKIWSIVNTIAKEKPKPILRIGLFAYGNGDKNARLYQLNGDLDEVYKNLMSFKDEGWGTEWVGWAIKEVTDKMEWSKEKNALKVIFVVGNETARQGPKEVDYTKTAPKAIEKGIMINAIYCGKPSKEEEATWQEAARLADGTYIAIDQSGGAISIETPFDKELSELNNKLNETYVYYGKNGKKSKDNQQEQDDNSNKHGGLSNEADRTCQKMAYYDCSRWDLVDACKGKDFKIEGVEKETLPKELQTLTIEELKAHVEKKSKDRDDIHKKIKETSEKREKFIEDEMKKQKLDDSKSLDKNLKEIMLKQLRK